MIKHQLDLQKYRREAVFLFRSTTSRMSAFGTKRTSLSRSSPFSGAPI